MAREASGAAVNDADDGDEALRQIEVGLAIVEEAMSERQRSLAEVDQQLCDLQAMAGCGVSLRPSLDPVAEAASEDAGTTPLLRNSRSITDASPEESKTCNGEVTVSDGVAAALDVTILRDFTHGEVSEEKTRSPPPAASIRCGESQAATKQGQPRWLQGSPDDNGKAVLDQGLSPRDRRLVPASGTSGGILSESACSRGRARREGTAHVTRMSSGPRPVEVLPPRPYVEAPGSLRVGSPRTTSLEPQVLPVAAVVTRGSLNGIVNGGNWSAFGYHGAATPTASVSPSRVASVRSGRTEATAQSSKSSLSNGVFTPVAPPRGSSLPADARRIYAGPAPPPVTVGTPNVSSPRSSFSNSSVTGSFTPRLPPPHAALSARAGYPGMVANVSIPNGAPTTLDLTPRRSPSSPVSPRQRAPSTVSAGATYSQYGNRFSAVTSAASPAPVAASSRNATPQPSSASGRSGASANATAVVDAMTSAILGGPRFVPVAVPAYAAEARSRESSLGVSAPMPQQRAASISRALSPVGQAMATTALPMEQCRLRLWSDHGSSAQDSRAMSPTPRLPVSSSSTRPVQQGASARSGITASASMPSQQPSRYAYVNSNSRRECAPNTREARRRGRV